MTDKTNKQFAREFSALMKKHDVELKFRIENGSGTVPILCRLAFKILNHYGFTVNATITQRNKK